MKIISPKKKEMHIGNPTQRCFVDDALVVTAERLIVSRHWQALDTQKGPKQMPPQSKCHPHIQPIQEVSALGQLSARPRLPLPFLVFLGVVALQEGNFRIKKRHECHYCWEENASRAQSHHYNTTILVDVADYWAQESWPWCRHWSGFCGPHGPSQETM